MRAITVTPVVSRKSVFDRLCTLLDFSNQVELVLDDEGNPLVDTRYGSRYSTCS